MILPCYWPGKRYARRKPGMMRSIRRETVPANGFIERGDNVATLTVMLKLAKALDIDAGELLAEFTRAALKRMKL
jgi:hypothetical protein